MKVLQTSPLPLGYRARDTQYSESQLPAQRNSNMSENKLKTLAIKLMGVGLLDPPPEANSHFADGKSMMFKSNGNCP
jgi:hypothetical protein